MASANALLLAILQAPQPTTPHQQGQLAEMQHMARELHNDHSAARRMHSVAGDDLCGYIESLLGTLHLRARRLAATPRPAPATNLHPCFTEAQDTLS